MYVNNSEKIFEDHITRLENELETFQKNITENPDKINLPAKIARFKGLIWDCLDCIDEANDMHDGHYRMDEKIVTMRSQTLIPLMALFDTNSAPIAYTPIMHALIQHMRDIMKSQPYTSDRSSRYYACTNSVASTSRDPETMNTYFLGLEHNFIGRLMRRIVASQNRKFKVLLQSFSYDYIMLDEMDSVTNCDIYGMYPESLNLSPQDRERLTKVAIGPEDSISSSNNAFDIVQIRTGLSEYEILDSDGKMRPSREENQLTRAFRFVRDDGYVIATIPSWRLDRKVCTCISKNAELIYAGLASLQQFRTVILVLKKHSTIDKETAATTFQNLRRMFHVDGNTPSLITEETIDAIHIELPLNETKEVRLFKGPCPDRIAMIMALQTSTAYHYTPKKYDTKPRPLLPLSKGQIGQVLASGKLDGIIDEGDGNKHVIRGRVFKVTIQKREFRHKKDNEPYDVMTTTTRRNNCIEINVMAGNGTYKAITLTA